MINQKGWGAEVKRIAVSGCNGRIYSSSPLKVDPLTFPRRTIAQIPRFEAATKSQNNETSFNHERRPDSC
jgi:hypothetical protein